VKFVNGEILKVGLDTNNNTFLSMKITILVLIIIPLFISVLATFPFLGYFQYHYVRMHKF